jgi:hypothetical protein
MEAFRDQIVEQQRAAGVRVIKTAARPRFPRSRSVDARRKPSARRGAGESGRLSRNPNLEVRNPKQIRIIKLE